MAIDFADRFDFPLNILVGRPFGHNGLRFIRKAHVLYGFGFEGLKRNLIDARWVPTINRGDVFVRTAKKLYVLDGPRSTAELLQLMPPYFWPVNQNVIANMLEMCAPELDIDLPRLGFDVTLQPHVVETEWVRLSDKGRKRLHKAIYAELRAVRAQRQAGPAVCSSDVGAKDEVDG